MNRRFPLLITLVLLAGCSPGESDTPKASSPVPSKPHLVRTQQQKLRVVTLGDSLAHGTGDETGQGISGRLEAELQRRGIRGADTINLGINGAQTTDLEARLKQKRVREEIATADAIVLSIGANDLFRTPAAREQTMRNPLVMAETILGRISRIVGELHVINPNARVLILGGYNPVPTHPMAPLIEQYLVTWDEALASEFEDDRKVSIVKIADIVDRPDRLSRLDHFHPGGTAYGETAKRIAEMLVENAA